MISLLLVTLQASPPRSGYELQSTFMFLIAGVGALIVFLWILLSRFNRPL